MTEDEVAAARHWFAEELRHVARLRSPAVVRAFATVPREHFAGPGPWRLLSPWYLQDYWTTEDADPRHLYHDVLIAIDEARRLNNGQPSLWAFLYDQLDLAAGEHVVHVGIGTGYYSAILADIVGRDGAVTAVEIDAALAARARANLALGWPQANVVAADGFAHRPERPADAIIVNAGVTHLSVAWLDALAEHDGRLLVPLTDAHRAGAFLLITRQQDTRIAMPRAMSAALASSTASAVAIGTLRTSWRWHCEDRGSILRCGRCGVHRTNRTRPAGWLATAGGFRALYRMCEDHSCCNFGPTASTCDKDLPPNATDARICSFECTFCAHCVETVLFNVCPNCGGGFEPRPIRPATEHRPGVSLGPASGLDAAGPSEVGSRRRGEVCPDGAGRGAGAALGGTN